MGLPNLAIVAGSGSLPLQLAEHCQSIGRSYQIIKFNGTELDWATDHPIISAEFEKPKSLFSAIRKAGCKQIVFAGAIQRPKLNPLKFDLAFLKFAPTLRFALLIGAVHRPATLPLRAKSTARSIAWITPAAFCGSALPGIAGFAKSI